MKNHSLKILTEYYKAVECGNKLFEVRKNDCCFEVGDYINLREWIPVDIMRAKPAHYTGRLVRRQITYITNLASIPGVDFDEQSVMVDYVVLGFVPEISELGCQLLGHPLHVGTTDLGEIARCYRYMMDLFEFVGRMQKAALEAKKGKGEAIVADGFSQEQKASELAARQDDDPLPSVTEQWRIWEQGYLAGADAGAAIDYCGNLEGSIMGDWEEFQKGDHAYETRTNIPPDAEGGV